MKVAQYEVLGSLFLSGALPISIRDDRWLLVLLKSLRDQEPNVSIVPCGTDISFLHHFPALRTGLLSLSPSGTKVLTVRS
jgi:hypothetical protein